MVSSPPTPSAEKTTAFALSSNVLTTETDQANNDQIQKDERETVQEDDNNYDESSTGKPPSSRKRPRSDTPIHEDSAALYDRSNNDSTYGSTVAAATNPSLIPLLSDSLYGMLDGIPRKELKLVISEANECEKALEEELEQLKNALKQIQEQKQDNTKSQDEAVGNTKDSTTEVPPVASLDLSPSVSIMLESEVTPPDRYWTLSALLGRLRHDMTSPLPPNSQLPALREKAGLQNLVMPKKKRTNSIAVITGTTGDGTGTTSGRSTPNIPADDSQFQRLSLVQNHPDYVVEHENPDKLLTVWRKISTHRSSLVFRRPVNPKDAPGYSDRILFPMDLSLIRKLIVARIIRSYHDLAQRIHLIGHNCVKYNGRESDYALVTREFESYACEYILTAVYTHSMTIPAVSNAGPGNPGRPSKLSRQSSIQGDMKMMSASPTHTTSTNPTSAAPTGLIADDKMPEGADTTEGQTKEQQQPREEGNAIPESNASNITQTFTSNEDADSLDVDEGRENRAGTATALST
jgi:hypothetical protein